MIWRLLEGQDVQPKFVVNACPKHGLHLLAMLVEGAVDRMPESIYNANHWAGTYRWNSFIPEWRPMERWFFLMSRLRQGYYTQGHVGWRQDVNNYLKLSRMAHVFVYRDLRDAAVSMAHHVLSSDEKRNYHPAKAMYRALGGFDDVLTAVICGLGPFPGAVALFESYAPWLDEEWVHLIRFEDAIEDLEGTARGILEYGLDQITRDLWEVEFRVEGALFDRVVQAMVASAAQKEKSPTFRKGEPGEWQEVFTGRHRDLFKKCDANGWLVRLGYEEREDW